MPAGRPLQPRRQKKAARRYAAARCAAAPAKAQAPARGAGRRGFPALPAAVPALSISRGFQAVNAHARRRP